MPTTALSIAVEPEGPLWRLVVRPHGTPAGPRLFRSEPWPGVRFWHFTREAAEKDAARLGRYLEQETGRRGRRGRT